jgi:hypothetical protein
MDRADDPGQSMDRARNGLDDVLEHCLWLSDGKFYVGELKKNEDRAGATGEAK